MPPNTYAPLPKCALQLSAACLSADDSQVPIAAPSDSSNSSLLGRGLTEERALDLDFE